MWETFFKILLSFIFIYYHLCFLKYRFASNLPASRWQYTAQQKLLSSYFPSGYAAPLSISKKRERNIFKRLWGARSLKQKPQCLWERTGKLQKVLAKAWSDLCWDEKRDHILRKSKDCMYSYHRSNMLQGHKKAAHEVFSVMGLCSDTVREEP